MFKSTDVDGETKDSVLLDEKTSIESKFTSNELKDYPRVLAQLKALSLKSEEADFLIIRMWIMRRVNPFRSFLNSFQGPTPQPAIEILNNANKALYNSLTPTLITDLDLTKESTLNAATLYVLKNPSSLSDSDRMQIARHWSNHKSGNEQSINKYAYSNQFNLLPQMMTFDGLVHTEKVGIEIIDNIGPIIEEIKKEIEKHPSRKTKDFGERYDTFYNLANKIVYLRNSHSIVMKRQAIRMLPTFVGYLSKIHESELAGFFLTHINDALIELDEEGHITLNR